MSDVQGPFLSSLFGTQYWLFSWQIYDGSIFWCVNMYSICVISIFVVFCKWKVQVQFTRKALAMKLQLKKKIL